MRLERAQQPKIESQIQHTRALGNAVSITCEKHTRVAACDPIRILAVLDVARHSGALALGGPPGCRCRNVIDAKAPIQDPAAAKPT